MPGWLSHPGVFPYLRNRSPVEQCKMRYFMLHIVIAAFEFEEAPDCQNQRRQFRCHDGPPDAVQAKEQGQNQYRRDLADQGSDKGDHRGDQAVIQRRKQGAAEDIKAAQQERQGIDQEAPHRHFQQNHIIAHENRRLTN